MSPRPPFSYGGLSFLSPSDSEGRDEDIFSTDSGSVRTSPPFSFKTSPARSKPSGGKKRRKLTNDTLSECPSSDEQPSPTRRGSQRTSTPPPSASDIPISLPDIEPIPSTSRGTSAATGGEPIPQATFAEGQAPTRVTIGGASYVLQVDRYHTVDPAFEEEYDQSYDHEADWGYEGEYDNYFEDGFEEEDGEWDDSSVGPDRCVTATGSSVSVELPHPSTAQASGGESSSTPDQPSPPAAESLEPPPSPPQKPEEEIWFPPPRAFAAYSDRESVLFFLDNKPFGFFQVADRTKGTF